MSIEAMKQALDKACEAMEAAGKRIDELKAENASLRQAIAEAEKQEPAMRIEYWPSADSDRYIANMIPWERLPIGTLLYTSPKVEQEPVAWFDPVFGDICKVAKTLDKPNRYTIPLYTSPPQRQPLTDEERMAIPPMYSNGGQLAYAEAIEAKLKEKNT